MIKKTVRVQPVRVPPVKADSKIKEVKPESRAQARLQMRKRNKKPKKVRKVRKVVVAKGTVLLPAVKERVNLVKVVNNKVQVQAVDGADKAAVQNEVLKAARKVHRKAVLSHNS